MVAGGEGIAVLSEFAHYSASARAGCVVYLLDVSARNVRRESSPNPPVRIGGLGALPREMRGGVSGGKQLA